MSIISNSAVNAVNGAKQQGHAILAGAGMAAGSVAGYGLGKMGDKIAEKYGGSDSMNGSGDKPDSGNVEGKAESATTSAADNDKDLATNNDTTNFSDSETELSTNTDNSSDNDNMSSTVVGGEADTSRSPVSTGSHTAITNISRPTGASSDSANIPESISDNSGEASRASIDDADSADTNITEGNQINDVSKESVSDVTEGNNTAMDSSEQMSMSESAISSDTSSMTDTAETGVISSDTMTSELSNNDQSSVNDVSNTSEASIANTNKTETANSTNAHASASVAKSDNTTVTKNGLGSNKSPRAGNAGVSMGNTTNAGGGVSAGRVSTGGVSATNAGNKINNQQAVNAQQTSSVANGNSINAHTKTSGATAGTKQKSEAEQRRAKTMNAIARGLQAAGNHTTKGQMIAGVTAGMAHMAGGAVGAQSITQHGVDAVRREKARSRDIANGRPGDFTLRQEQQANAMNAIAGVINRQDTSAKETSHAYTNNTVNNATYYAEELARQEFEAAATRRDPSNAE